jgi:hypothetical protein
VFGINGRVGMRKGEDEVICGVHEECRGWDCMGDIAEGVFVSLACWLLVAMVLTTSARVWNREEGPC